MSKVIFKGVQSGEVDVLFKEKDEGSDSVSIVVERWGKKFELTFSQPKDDDEDSCGKEVFFQSWEKDEKNPESYESVHRFLCFAEV